RFQFVMMIWRFSASWSRASNWSNVWLNDSQMSFTDFYGNPEVVRRLREMLKRDRFPHAAILSGLEGAGKYTLALKLARIMNCLNPIQQDGRIEYFCSCPT